MTKVKTETNRWYAIRVLYGREMKLKELLDVGSIKNFVPMQQKLITVKGTTRKVCVPAIRNLIFVYATRSFLNALKTECELHIPFRHIMDRTSNQPIVIQDREMDHFIAVSGTMNQQLLYLTKVNLTLRNGDRVKVTGGPFAGVEGNVVRIKKDRRVMVLLNNLIAVVTAHINPLLLKKIETI